ncbi:hypothetical protein HJC23_000313 [Cyclotella cryptica]|uniref:Uncharacterized protein n=1 Tax=Cyclotella cryptica TaxID=29204 RepID=A0ABD3NN33_9STRA
MKFRHIAILFLIAIRSIAISEATLTIAATDSGTGEIGAIGTSCSNDSLYDSAYQGSPGNGLCLTVGAVVPSLTSPVYGVIDSLLATNIDPQSIINSITLLSLDTATETVINGLSVTVYNAVDLRQYACVDLQLRAAGYTGIDIQDYYTQLGFDLSAGWPYPYTQVDTQGLYGSDIVYSAQGDIVSATTVTTLSNTFSSATACDLLCCIKATNAFERAFSVVDSAVGGECNPASGAERQSEIGAAVAAAPGDSVGFGTAPADSISDLGGGECAPRATGTGLSENGVAGAAASRDIAAGAAASRRARDSAAVTTPPGDSATAAAASQDGAVAAAALHDHAVFAANAGAPGTRAAADRLPPTTAVDWMAEDDTTEDAPHGEKVREIMRNVISPKSAISYANQNVVFILWLHNSPHRSLLEESFVEALDSLENEKEMKKWIKDILLKMHPRSVCPVILCNLTFDIFSEYLASKKLSRKHIGNVSNTLSASSYDSYRSALMHLYRMSKYDMDSHFATDLSQFMTGMKRTTDQLGKRSDAIWHVYATPNSPSTCCHLALARYLFANPGILLNHDSSRGPNKLFPGSNQYERFMKVFHRVMHNNEEAFHVSGMGGIKERYLHFENAGDQYLGRVVAGLDSNEYLFAVSPPYFDLSTVANEEEIEKSIDELVARATNAFERAFSVVDSAVGGECNPASGAERQSEIGAAVAAAPGDSVGFGTARLTVFQTWVECCSHNAPGDSATAAAASQDGAVAAAALHDHAVFAANAGALEQGQLLIDCRQQQLLIGWQRMTLQRMHRMGRNPHRSLLEESFVEALDSLENEKEMKKWIKDILLKMHPSYRSALMHLYRMSKYDMDSHFATDLSQFMTGMKRTTDQLGKRSDAIWHVYATPNSPSTCCHLALARYLFANPGILLNHDSSRGPNKLFPGSNQYERFMKVFHRVMHNNEEAFLRVGQRDQLSHRQLYRFVLAMWSMGGIKERYLHFENAGDQYLGRVVAGLDSNEYLFAVSPPYFDLSTVANEEEIEKSIDELVASSDHSVVAVQDTALCFQEDEKTQYSLFVGKEGIMRRLPDDYVFPSMTFALFISYWFCGDKSKNLVPICVIDRKDVKSKLQKNVLSKMKMLMNLVEVAAKREGVWKGSKYYRSDVQLCNELCISVQKYFAYPTKNDHAIYEDAGGPIGDVRCFDTNGASGSSIFLHVDDSAGNTIVHIETASPSTTVDPWPQFKADYLSWRAANSCAPTSSPTTPPTTNNGGALTIAAADSGTGEIGAIGTSCSNDSLYDSAYQASPGNGLCLTVGAVVPSLTSPVYGVIDSLLATNIDPQSIINSITLLSLDTATETVINGLSVTVYNAVDLRQYACVDLQRRAAGYTGIDIQDYYTQLGFDSSAGWPYPYTQVDTQGLYGSDIVYSAQGDIVSATTVTTLSNTFSSATACDLAERLYLSLQAIYEDAGGPIGDVRCFDTNGASGSSIFLHVDDSAGNTIVHIETASPSTTVDPWPQFKADYLSWRAANSCAPTSSPSLSSVPSITPSTSPVPSRSFIPSTQSSPTSPTDSPTVYLSKSPQTTTSPSLSRVPSFRPTTSFIPTRSHSPSTQFSPASPTVSPIAYLSQSPTLTARPSPFTSPIESPTRSPVTSNPFIAPAQPATSSPPNIASITSSPTNPLDVFYPDWEGSNTCVNDGKQPSWMYVSDPWNNKYFTTSQQECCDTWYFWDSRCVQTAVTAFADNSTGNPWYPDWQSSNTCQSDGKQPTWMYLSDGNVWKGHYFSQTQEECCDNFFWWDLKCMSSARSAQEGPSLSSNPWYPDYASAQTCVSDGKQ